MKTKIEKPYHDLGYLLTQVSFLKQRIINHALREIDITYMQFVILAGIYELRDEGRIVSQQTISDQRRLDKAMVSNVVKTLLAKGYLIRERHTADKRAFTLILTQSGEQKAIKGKKIAKQIDNEFFSGIDKASFSETLTLLLRNEPMKDE